MRGYAIGLFQNQNNFIIMIMMLKKGGLGVLPVPKNN
jgi:hypothetical protein